MILCICINLKGSDYWNFTNQIGILIYLLLCIRLLLLSCCAGEIFKNSPDNTMVLGLNPKRPEQVSQYLTWFFMRRIWLGISIIFLTPWPTLQIINVMISSTIEMKMILNSRILLEKKDKFQQLINEGAIFTTCCFLFTFTDMYVDLYARNVFCVIFVIMLMVLLFGNMAYLLQ